MCVRTEHFVLITDTFMADVSDEQALPFYKSADSLFAFSSDHETREWAPLTGSTEQPHRDKSLLHVPVCSSARLLSPFNICPLTWELNQ